MIVEKNKELVEHILTKRGFEKASDNVWCEKVFGNFARIVDGNQIRVVHTSGYRFVDEKIDSDESFDAVLSALETSSFVPPPKEVVSVLAGMTDPKYFIAATPERFVIIASDSHWVEEAKEVGRMYTWRTTTKGFEIKVRGKAQFKVAKGEHFGYRTNENGHLFIIKLGGVTPKEYRINKGSMELIEKNSKARRGAPPKLNLDKPVTKTTKKSKEPKTAVVTTPKTRAAKPDATSAMDALTEAFGKGVTARQVKAALFPLIELPSWPTTKKALFEAIVKKYSSDIVDILVKRNNAANLSTQLPEKDAKIFAEALMFSKEAIRWTLRDAGIDFPKGGFTTDPDFEARCVKLLFDSFGPEKALEKIKTKALELETVKNQRFERLNKTAMEQRRADIFSNRGSPKAPSKRKIHFTAAKPPSQYQLNKTAAEDKAEETKLSKALKIFINELYAFAGGQIRPVLPGTEKMFRSGNAVREMFQVDTAPSDVSQYSAEQFLTAFEEKFKTNKYGIKILGIDRESPGVKNEEATVRLSVKGVPNTNIKLVVKVNPENINSTLTKHNLMVHQASARARFRVSRLKNASTASFNLTVIVTEDFSNLLYS